MANRAYLYASTSDVHEAFELPDDSEYFDSRWTVPLAWWFLFGPDDLRLVDVSYRKSTWKELRLVAERDAAIDRFARHCDAIIEFVREQLDRRYFDYFKAVLSARSGRYLILDTHEVLENEAEYDAALILPILRAIESNSISLADAAKRLSSYSPIRSSDHADIYVIGCTYGAIADRFWVQIMEDRDHSTDN